MTEFLDSQTDGLHLVIKNEALQKCGAFKARGAFNAALLLSAEERMNGVITHSSGNHAGALAAAAKTLQIPAYIVMPRNALKVKKLAVESYGGKVIQCEPTQQSREETAAKVMLETGATMIPPYDDDRVIAGQGTVALEILEQCGDVDAIITCCGGGGLLSGIAIAAKALKPGIKVFGAEPEEANDAWLSLRNGVRTPLSKTPDTIADGLKTTIGLRNWDVISRLVDGVFTVSEKEIVHWMKMVFERCKLVIEPSSAVTVAAVMTPEFRAVAREFNLKNVAVVISGGNVDLDALPWLVKND
eukprot:ANDGO_02414.mRNA.1 Serine racemase